MISKNQLKLFTSFNKKKNRQEAGVFLIEGPKLLEEAINCNAKLLHIIARESFFDSWHGKIDESLKVIAGAKDLERISSFKNAPEVIAIVKQFDSHKIDTEKEIIIALDHINDPGNLGTIIRTCDWFGITDIICSKNSVELYNPKVIQSSMGSVFRVNLHFVDLSPEFLNLKENFNYKIILTGVNANSIYNQKISDKKVVVFGSESHGISKELLPLADYNIAIPRFGRAESLNVAIANAIILSELKR